MRMRALHALLVLSTLVAACAHPPAPAPRRNTPVERRVLAERAILLRAARIVAVGRGLEVVYSDPERGRLTALSPARPGPDGDTRERWHYHIADGSIAVHRFVEHRAGDHWRTSPYLTPTDDRRREQLHLDAIATAMGGLAYGMTIPLPAAD
jgi:hypothetical protein